MRRNFFKYIFFNMLSMIGMSCYVLADTLFISNGVGLNGLAALNLTLPVYNLIFGLGALIGVGGATRFSILNVQDKDKEASAYFTYAFFMALLFSVPFLIGGLFFPQEIVILLGADGQIVSIASIYLRTFIIFTPFFILEHMMIAFVRNDHNPKLASIAMLSATLFNVIFDYILVFPMNLGMFGAALATGVSPVIALSICNLHFIKKQNHFHFIKYPFHLSIIKNIIQIGIPSLIGELSGGIIILVFNQIIFSIGGNIALASYGVISNLAIVVTSLYGGISQGMQPLISQSYARKDFHQTHSYLKYAFVTSFVISLIIYIFILFYTPEIIALFNSEGDPMMINIALNGLLIYFFGFFFAGMNMIIISYFAAVEKMKPSSLLSLLRGGIVIIPLVIIFAQFFLMNGVWLSFPVSELMIMLVAVSFLWKENHQDKYNQNI